MSWMCSPLLLDACTIEPTVVITWVLLLHHQNRPMFSLSSRCIFRHLLIKPNIIFGLLLIFYDQTVHLEFIHMASLPVPVPNQSVKQVILSIADLEEAASAKLNEGIRGTCGSCSILGQDGI